RLKAIRAAELDAKRKLAEQVYGLRLTSETLVRDFVTEHDVIMSELDNVLLLYSTVQDTQLTDDTAIVTVMIPGVHVWDIVGEGMYRDQRQP
ncbi:MAG: hypothetical protein JXO22_15150, partial [Phycisphaerae bacterium]|nr:hypothetical protein [Phycisphaerae bacterium]